MLHGVMSQTKIICTSTAVKSSNLSAYIGLNHNSQTIRIVKEIKNHTESTITRKSPPLIKYQINKA